MGEPNFSINFSAKMLATDGCEVGDVLVYDSALGYWKVATDANRTAANAGSQAIALSAYGGSAIGKVAYQSAGVLAAEISGLEAGSDPFVRVSSAGRLERVATVTEGDDIIGKAEADGRVHLGFGLYNIAGASITLGGDIAGDTNAQTVIGWRGLPLDEATMGTPEEGALPTWNPTGGEGGTGAWVATAPEVQVPAPGGVGYALISDDGLVYVSRPLTEDDLQPAFNVTMGGAQTVEVGATVATPAFTASYTGGPATSATLTDNDGSSPKALISPFTAVSSDASPAKTTNNASITYTITAHKGAVSDTSSVVIAWRPKVYHGAAVSGTLNEAFIEALATSNLQSSRVVSYTDNATSGKYLWYAAPSSYGTPTFTVGGFAGGFGDNPVATVSVTNAQGVTQNYDLWRSENHSLLSTSVVVT